MQASTNRLRSGDAGTPAVGGCPPERGKIDGGRQPTQSGLTYEAGPDRPAAATAFRPKRSDPVHDSQPVAASAQHRRTFVAAVDAKHRTGIALPATWPRLRALGTAHPPADRKPAAAPGTLHGRRRSGQPLGSTDRRRPRPASGQPPAHDQAAGPAHPRLQPPRRRARLRRRHPQVPRSPPRPPPARTARPRRRQRHPVAVHVRAV